MSSVWYYWGFWWEPREKCGEMSQTILNNILPVRPSNYDTSRSEFTTVSSDSTGTTGCEGPWFRGDSHRESRTDNGSLSEG